MIPPACPIRIQAITPPTNEPARPSPIVARIPIGSGPGSARRASAPTIRPLKASARMNQSTIVSALLGAQAFEQTSAGCRVLDLVEDARVVELLEQSEVVGRVLGWSAGGIGTHRCSGRLRRPHLLESAERLDPDPVGVDARPLQPLAVLVDAEAALREAVGVGTPERALLDEAPVDDHERHGREEARKGRPRGRVAPPDADHEPGPDPRPREADADREPGRHRIRPRQREARERPGDEGDEHRSDNGSEHVRSVAKPREAALCADRYAAVCSRACSSRRRSLTSSRSFAAYSKRSSSAARYISSSSVTTSFSSSSRDIPSTFVAPRRRRVGTVGDSSWSSSAMSETPFAIVSGTIPCSTLYARWTARRRFVSSSACTIASVCLSAYISTLPLTFRAARPIVWIRLVRPRRKPSLSASRIATSDTSGRSSPSRGRLTPTRTSNSPSRKSRMIWIRSSVSISEWR